MQFSEINKFLLPKVPQTQFIKGSTLQTIFFFKNP